MQSWLYLAALLSVAACACASTVVAVQHRDVATRSDVALRTVAVDAEVVAEQLCGLTYEQIEQIPCGYKDDDWSLLAQQLVFAMSKSPPCSVELIQETQLYLDENCAPGSLACQNQTTQELFDALVECSGENLSYCECSEACAARPVVTVVTSTIQEAINRSCPYGVVLVPPGEYNEPMVQIFKNRRGQLLDGLRVQGLTGASLVSLGSPAIFIGDRTDFIYGVNPRPMCPPRGNCPGEPPDPDIDPSIPRSQVGPRGVIVRGLEVSNSSGTAVMAYGSHEYVFDQLYIHDNGRVGSGGSYGTFPICSNWGYTTNNLIVNSGVGIYNGDCDGGYVYNNTVRHCKAAMEIEATSNNDVAFNLVEDCEAGISVFTLPWLPRLGAYNNSVRNNTIVRCLPNPRAVLGSRSGFYLQGIGAFATGNLTLEFNTIVQAGVAGIAVADTPASYYASTCATPAYIDDPGRFAMPPGVLPGDAPCIPVFNNTCPGNPELVALRYPNDTRIVGNVFYNCGNDIDLYTFFGFTHGWDIVFSSNNPSPSICIDTANVSDWDGLPLGEPQSIYVGFIPSTIFYVPPYPTPLINGVPDVLGAATAFTGVTTQEPITSFRVPSCPAF